MGHSIHKSTRVTKEGDKPIIQIEQQEAKSSERKASLRIGSVD
jgi:hypothetical protein